MQTELITKMTRPTRISKANTISSSLRTTIPNDIVEYLDLKIGDVVDWDEYQEKGRKYARIRKLE
jgi:bifunctional DNA-binding transcriptional regulator/antitoxin component of YhaV-PrlF toxin-antitoxin module